MQFSANIFIYVFLPTIMITYFGIELIFRKHNIVLKNLFLVLVSLFFYLWGSGADVLILLASIFINYSIGYLIYKSTVVRKILLGIGIILNLGLLGYYKYGDFFMESFNNIFQNTSNDNLLIRQVMLPIGISFFTFQGMSYLIDVYRKDIEVQKNPLNLALYISFFPKLIAGPIARCKEMFGELDNRKTSLNQVYNGACRFCIGLSKKVLIADSLGIMVDSIFKLPFHELNTPLSWIGILGYTLQIFYDFSAYSDMAIGLAEIFGFHFKENFMMPYTSKNITEFWRRWHISLSSWFRDYLYIPLGGNRRGNIKTYVNLFIVFFMCGLWHGASWMFVIWGIYHGVLLIIERILKNKYNFTMGGIIGNIWTILLVMIGWLFFRSENLTYAIKYFLTMLGQNKLEGFQFYTLRYYLNNFTFFILLLSIIGAVFPLLKIKEFLKKEKIKGIVAIILLLFSMYYLSDATFNPFIYVQF